MSTHKRLQGFVVAVIAALCVSDCGPRLPVRIAPPNGLESVEYRDAYTAFWWNCTILKSVDLHARCPFTCSGTPAASAGCRAGAVDAENQIAELEKEYGGARTREFLAFRIGEDDGYSKLRAYFPYGPTPERVPDR